MTQEIPGLLKGAVFPAANTRLFGHQKAENFLARTYASGKMHHALVIEGPEGIGKATLAFRFAFHILHNPDSQNAPDSLGPPDPSSPAVKQIIAGASHDFLYLSYPCDEKTGKIRTMIPVSAIRRIHQFLSLKSVTGNWRIVMIDPADGMNRNAANAMLKILEEPPKRVLFILLSHVVGKLLPTVRSRCITLTLSPLSETDLEKALQHLGLSLSAQQIEILRLSAEGSVSEALKLLKYQGHKIMTAYTQFKEEEEEYVATKIMHQLMNDLSAKGDQVSFSFFVNLVTGDLVNRAKGAALSGHLEEAERIARLYSVIHERLESASIYNLDKKHSIFQVLDAIRQ
ncbi:DNA polymerase III delta prime subunit [Liberibacter crescens BT-1]|uniref:DNA polymerase III delta prime subunit n=1 Tax=Liberibacter crescens (strain BT-1) TaxID=1215343 RepID=L0ETC8_LIBCB|nr:DNA polymerase III subunit delta' [Liberibacter crescens]AGA64794.1 DNA polymerase III delta prime subunit [Liberibacter crescens BT-1]AMC12858.1 DNA polymerase III subunit delta' [Liberibacter crescens]